MNAYLIKSACCAAVLLLVYRFFLEREKMHRFNRCYLLASVVLALVIPVIQLPVTQTMIPLIENARIVFLEEENTQPVTTGIVTNISSKEALNLTIPYLLIVYTVIACFLFIRFAINLYKLITATRRQVVTWHKGIRIVVMKEITSSYTFLGTIFINETDFAGQESQVLKHEMAHVKQKHSLDILFIEIVRIIFWFNPLFIFYKRSIQLNHEFLADEAVVQHCADVPAYQHLLLDRIGLASHLPLGSRFNYSITKKRLEMMTQKTSYARAMLKKMMLLPLCIGCLFSFGIREAISMPAAISNVFIQDTTAKKKPQQSPEMVFPAVMLKDVPYTKQGISQEEMDEYQAVEKKYLDMAKTNREHVIVFEKIKTENQKRLQDLFLRMSREQQLKAHLVFMKALAPSKKRTPTPEQFESWKNPASYGVWINDKKVTNEELNKYTASDFSYFDAHNLRYNEAAKKNIMKRYNLKVLYKVQLNVMTNDYYDNYYKEAVQNLKENPYHIAIFWGRKPA